MAVSSSVFRNGWRALTLLAGFALCASVAANGDGLGWTDVNTPGTAERPAAPASSIAATVTQTAAIDFRDTLLKEDQFPGMLAHSKSTLPGAPNFRTVQGISGVAQPTAEAITEILRQLGSAPGAAGQKTTTWVNLRQEPVIYINGKPHNLRRVSSPFENLKTLKLDTESLERLEERIKKALQAEAAAHGGRVSLAIERPGAAASLTTTPVAVTTIETPRDLFGRLGAAGYNVQFRRIPNFDEVAPEPEKVDQILELVRSIDANSPLIFNCHAGQGRTTTGMVLGAMVRDAARPQDRAAADAATRAEFIRTCTARLGSTPEQARALDTFFTSKGRVDTWLKSYGNVVELREKVLTEVGKLPTGKSKSSDFMDRYFLLVHVDQYLRDPSRDRGEPFSHWRARQPLLGGMKTLMDTLLDRQLGSALPDWQRALGSTPQQAQALDRFFASKKRVDAGLKAAGETNHVLEEIGKIPQGGKGTKEALARYYERIYLDQFQHDSARTQGDTFDQWKLKQPHLAGIQTLVEALLDLPDCSGLK